MSEAFVSSLIQKQFRRSVWAPFCRAVEEFRLIRSGDRIAVCFSGGKDSTLLACCVRDYQRYGPVPFTFELLMLDPGYTKESRELALKNAALLGFDVRPEDCPIFDAVKNAPHSPCHVCAAMRRGYLYRRAAERGCSRIALGHHLDDVAETVLMSLLYGGQFRGMLPLVQSDNVPGMAMIRPLFYVRERDVVSWAEAAGIAPLTCACDVTRRQDAGARLKTKKLLEALEKETPNVVGNLLGSLSRVSLDTVLRYRENRDAPWVSHYPEGEAEIAEHTRE